MLVFDYSRNLISQDDLDVIVRLHHMGDSGEELLQKSPALVRKVKARWVIEILGRNSATSSKQPRYIDAEKLRVYVYNHELSDDRRQSKPFQVAA